MLTYLLFFGSVYGLLMYNKPVYWLHFGLAVLGVLSMVIFLQMQANQSTSEQHLAIYFVVIAGAALALTTRGAKLAKKRIGAERGIK